MKKAIVTISGGLDSVTLAYLLHSEGYDLHLLCIDYGQKHRKEIEYAKICADMLCAQYDRIDLTSITHLLKGSALTDVMDVPEGHYAAPNMAITVVPNRNAMMLAIAYAVAVAEKADIVAAGVHAGDHFIYPDCRPDFIAKFEAMEQAATVGYSRSNLRLLVPFLHMGKHQIVKLGTKLDVPYDLTWSCYKGKEKHCGLCGTCYERQEAFHLAGVQDPTEYEA